jgi:hypothetical protein
MTPPAVSATKRRASRKKAPATKPGAGPQSIERLLETGGTVIEDLRLVRFAGVALGGAKTDKTSVAILEFYPDKKRVFLRSLRDRVTAKGDVLADDALIDVLTKEEHDLASVAFDVPLQLPKCVRCEVKCPGMGKCTQPEVKWMREQHAKRAREKRPNKMFTPYTERASEVYIANELEEPFHPSHALGANAAPLTARAHFIGKRLRMPMVEVYPKLSLWRMGCALSIPLSYLRFHKHSVGSEEARHYILKRLIEKEIAFIYQQDLRTMVDDNIAFEAFICAMTAFLKHRGQTEKRPTGFPKGELWIDFPRERIQWF